MTKKTTPTTETSKPISRQWAQQQRLRAEGKCPVCWQKLVLDTTICYGCRQKKNEYARRVKGFKPWQPGKPGRPPRQFRQSDNEYLSPVEYKMKKADWSLSNLELSWIYHVSDSTIRKYRKIFGGKFQKSSKQLPKYLRRAEMKKLGIKHTLYKTIIQSVDWRATNDEISYATKIPRRTINNYRKKHAPETLPKRASRVAIAKSKSPTGGASGKRQNTDGAGRSSKV